MNINDFPAMQEEFTSLIRRNSRAVQSLVPGATETVAMEFLKPDYSSIAQGFPVSRIRSSFNAEQTVDEFLADLQQLVSRITNGSTNSIIYCSPLHLDYNPKHSGLPNVVAFDIAAMNYDGQVVTYPLVTNNRSFLKDLESTLIVYKSSGPCWHFAQYEVTHKHAKHTLLKKQAVEINVWLPNIISGVAQNQHLTSEGYVRSVREEFDNNAFAARKDLNELLDFAVMQDQAAGYASCKTDAGLKPPYSQCEAACNVVTAVLGVPVEIEVVMHQLFFVIEGQRVPSNELFNYAVTRRFKNV